MIQVPQACFPTWHTEAESWYRYNIAWILPRELLLEVALPPVRITSQWGLTRLNVVKHSTCDAKFVEMRCRTPITIVQWPFYIAGYGIQLGFQSGFQSHIVTAPIIGMDIYLNKPVYTNFSCFCWQVLPFVHYKCHLQSSKLWYGAEF